MVTYMPALPGSVGFPVVYPDGDRFAHALCSSLQCTSPCAGDKTSLSPHMHLELWVLLLLPPVLSAHQLGCSPLPGWDREDDVSGLDRFIMAAR